MKGFSRVHNVINIVKKPIYIDWSNHLLVHACALLPNASTEESRSLEVLWKLKNVKMKRIFIFILVVVIIKKVAIPVIFVVLDLLKTFLAI